MERKWKMASERCAEQGVVEVGYGHPHNQKLGTMGSPFTAKEFRGTRRGLRCEAQAKRSGNTEFSPSSY